VKACQHVAPLTPEILSWLGLGSASGQSLYPIDLNHIPSRIGQYRQTHRSLEAHVCFRRESKKVQRL
jgi:hypothetical protein